MSYISNNASEPNWFTQVTMLPILRTNGVSSSNLFGRANIKLNSDNPVTIHGRPPDGWETIFALSARTPAPLTEGFRLSRRINCTNAGFANDAKNAKTKP